MAPSYSAKRHRCHYQNPEHIITQNAQNMVYARRQNAKADANPSDPVFSKEQNDLIIQNVHEYSLYAMGEKLNIFVLGLNGS